MYLYLMFYSCVGEPKEEHLIDGHVKRRDDFLRVGVELTVQLCVKLFQMSAVHVEKRVTRDTNLYIVHHNITYIH